MISVLKYPYPYKAWLSISNDPDNTNWATWNELNEYIFQDLKLDWANSIFPFSFNQNLPDQVNLFDYPDIAKQPIDTIHTWGDFVHAKQKGFCREDAKSAIALLDKYAIKPLVWVDHSRFTGNLIHNSDWGAKPKQVDSSGLSYTVHEYTLDLIRKYGVRYIWDGKLTYTKGQDRPVKWKDILEPYSIKGKFLYLLINFLDVITGKHLLKLDNQLLTQKKFPDGNMFYTFKRYGLWDRADINGLAEVISVKNIDQLLKKTGAMVVYTHLGKRSASDSRDKHIPEPTKRCFLYIKKKIKSKELLFSSVSKLLDYIVLRDGITIQDNDTIVFNADGIRYESLSVRDLNNFSFSFKNCSAKTKVLVNGQILEPRIELHPNGVSTFHF